MKKIHFKTDFIGPSIPSDLQQILCDEIYETWKSVYTVMPDNLAISLSPGSYKCGEVSEADFESYLQKVNDIVENPDILLFYLNKMHYLCSLLLTNNNENKFLLIIDKPGDNSLEIY